jgi:glucose/arabinose dehydrogenase
VQAPTDSNYPGNDDKGGWESRINVPAGFSVSYYGRVQGSPTSIDFSPVDGQLYIAVQEGTIYKMDASGNVSTYVGGYNTPTGIAFRPSTGQLYVSSRVSNENVGGEAQVSIVNGGQIVGGLPCCYTFYHAANGIAFGPDGFGYVGVGARADHGEILDGPNAGQQDELHPLEASILRFNPDTGEVSVYATGFRNPYDIAWDASGTLWATDNSPDFDPPERLHRVVPGAIHGYPYYDCDVCFSPPDGVTVIPPLGLFTPSSSPTGVTAYRGNQFPGYSNAIFVTLWSAFPGAQKVMHIGAGGSSAPVNFATGFAAPIDVITGPDGSLYVADWATGIIFKISYTG